MTDRLKLFRMLMPAEFVLFDHNPEMLRVKREQTGGAPSKPSGGGGMPQAGLTAGTLGAVFHGTDPLELTISKARLVGPNCKMMVDTLLGWLSPMSGMVGAVVGRFRFSVTIWARGGYPDAAEASARLRRADTSW